MEYILFIHNNARTRASAEEWDCFFTKARASGMFAGGSEIANRQLLGMQPGLCITDSIGGFMRFEADDKSALLQLLESHPVLVHGGTIELCEMPRT